MIKSFPILVDYTQVVAFCRSLEHPGLLWTDDHVAQGFACNDRIACFGVPDHDGECLLEVDLEATQASLTVDASLWVIAVPFHADGSQLRIGTILDDKPFTLAAGLYRLVFEAHPARSENGTEYTYVLIFRFIPAEHAEFEILRQGSLGSGKVLRTTADPA